MKCVCVERDAVSHLLHHRLSHGPQLCGLQEALLLHGLLHRLRRAAHVRQARVVQQGLRTAETDTAPPTPPAATCGFCALLTVV